MFIKLCLGQNTFHVVRLKDIISIHPGWLDENVFDCYYLTLADIDDPIELTQSQGNELIHMLDCKTVRPK